MHTHLVLDVCSKKKHVDKECFSLIPRLFWNVNVCTEESLVSFLMWPCDIIEIGPQFLEQKDNILRVYLTNFAFNVWCV